LEAQTQEGRSSDEIREWRANIGGSYTFDRDSFLGGWLIGGSVRWQDSQVIGYPIVLRTDSEGNDVALRDISRPVSGPTDTKVDTWIRYKTKILDDKVNWTLQLNVRNLFDENDLIDARLNYGGLPNIVRFNEGRRFILSSTFDF